MEKPQAMRPRGVGGEALGSGSMTNENKANSAPVIGPSANQQRLAAAQFVVKESQAILNTVLKQKGLDAPKGK